MATSERSLMRVLRMPELFNAIVQYFSAEDIHTLRLVSTLFLDQCAAHFSITLNLEAQRRYSDLQKLADSALAIKEGAVMASTGRTDETDHERSSPLDLIQTLKVSRGRYGHKSLTPAIVSILNQCRNLRHILINDNPGSTAEFPEKQSYPARLLWSSMFPVVQGGGRGDDGDGSDDGGGSDDGEQYWTFWDLLPLEGFLFDRLESLTINVEYNSQLNLDQFMPRLGRSHAAKSLRALTMTSRRKRGVSWEVFRDCICNLSVLKVLRMNPTKITYTKDPLIDTDDGSQHEMVEQPQQVAPTVNSLECVFDSRQNSDIRLAFMSLFPNVESLKLTDLDSLLNKAVDERIYAVVDRQLPLQQEPLGQQYSTSSVEGNDAPPHQIPFPLLRSLDCSNFSAGNWADSRVLRHWIQRAPNFRLASLCVSNRDVNNSPHEELSVYSVSLAQISIQVRREDYVKELLSSRLCRNLEVLGFDDTNLDCASVLNQAGSAFPSQSSISDVSLLKQQDLFTRLPWTQTLTTIRFRTLLYSSSASKDTSDRSAAFLRSFLKLLPRLVDFEVVDPIMDLSIFAGLGRQVTTSNVDDPTCAGKTHNDWPNSAQEEEPEKVYHGNGGYDPSNFGTSIDWDLYYD
ncbi:hypothetical protein BG015_002051 [Linnemannia schmuckeri]|uniref:Uncharacterized protein n=1 Tax=Linnemannia schmuckeri TaxID=64567 RepID=A0A9P5RNZ0_9FUNG|nr:hypothetical protein BG015_002051 [Linnemannia schmuckeri]